MRFDRDGTEPRRRHAGLDAQRDGHGQHGQQGRQLARIGDVGMVQTRVTLSRSESIDDTRFQLP